MGTPVIGSYPMPGRPDIPRSHRPWNIDPARAALLVHDMQNHLIQAYPPGSSLVTDLIDNITTLRELAATLGMPVVFSAEPPARDAESGNWGAGIDDLPDGASIVPQLAPRAGEHVLANVRQNAFLRSHLGRLLRTTGRDQLILCGLRAHLGILLTAADALMHDIQPFVVADGVADFTAEEHTMALQWTAHTGVVCTTDQLIRELLHGRAAQGF